MTDPTASGPHLDGLPEGMPSVEAVAAHELAHPASADRGHHPGAVWLCYHTDSHFGAYPALVTLRVGKAIDKVMVPDAGYKFIDAEGDILLANGFSFWQPLKHCRWAHSSIYVPCTAQGIPLLSVPRE